jgi:hypothetical protein
MNQEYFWIAVSLAASSRHGFLQMRRPVVSIPPQTNSGTFRLVD